MAYKKLNEALKKELLKKVDEMEVNVEGLDSYHLKKSMLRRTATRRNKRRGPMG